MGRAGLGRAALGRAALTATHLFLLVLAMGGVAPAQVAAPGADPAPVPGADPAPARPTAQAAAPTPADLVLVVRRVVRSADDLAQPVPPVPTAPGQLPAVVVRDGKVVALTTEAAAQAALGPQTRVLRRPEAVLYPGFVDAHGHLLGLGLLLDAVDLRDLGTYAQVVDRVAEAHRAGPNAKPDPGWLSGRGWDQNRWPGRALPHHSPLSDAVPDRPVALRRVDGHAVLLNAAAMRAAGLDPEAPAPADPAGGRIERDARGRPTGVFVDAAMARVERAIPAPDRAAVERALGRAIAACRAVGLTGAHLMGERLKVADILRDAIDKNPKSLSFRATIYLAPGTPGTENQRLAGPRPHPFAPLRGVKLVLDGALGSRGALLGSPYADAPEHRGLATLSPAQLQRQVAAWGATGWQVASHAIGDAAVAQALDTYAAALAPAPASSNLPGLAPIPGRPGDHRWRIEHAQVVRPEDLPRFAALGVIASVQPTHATSDMGWAAERLGPERVRWAYPMARLRSAGARLALGSDFPVERPAVLDGLQAAVTRQDAQGQPASGWQPADALDVVEAVRGFTEGAAYAAFQEGHRGRIAPGFDADFTLLGSDLREVPPRRWAQVPVLGVVVAGAPHLNP